MKNKAKAGLTLVEMLCTVVIMLLVSIGMVNGVSLAVRSYQKSLMASESQVLCSTLTNVVSDELRYSGTTYWPEQEGEPVRFYSRTYGDKCSFGQNEAGQVTLGDQKLLPSKAYHYGMQAQVNLGRKADNTFSVIIQITSAQGQPLAETTFDVEKLNPQRNTN